MGTSNTKTATKVDVKKSYKKELGIAVVNFILAFTAIYMFEFWFKRVIQLDNFQMITNLGAVVMAIVTFFVAKTYYGRGTGNSVRKIFITFGLGALTVGLMLISVKVPVDIVYPLSGLILVGIAFYMLILSSNTLTLVGIIIFTMIFGGIIAYAKMFNYIDWTWVGHLTEAGIFVILLIGGVWPHVRRFMHGVTGVNKDGGGFGGNEDEFGDQRDGNGDDE